MHIVWTEIALCQYLKQGQTDTTPTLDLHKTNSLHDTNTRPYLQHPYTALTTPLHHTYNTPTLDLHHTYNRSTPDLQHPYNTPTPDLYKRSQDRWEETNPMQASIDFHQQHKQTRHIHIFTPYPLHQLTHAHTHTHLHTQAHISAVRSGYWYGRVYSPDVRRSADLHQQHTHTHTSTDTQIHGHTHTHTHILVHIVWT